jgi:indolepyruvate ferredoxin oxidoreductase alpha subunit
MLPPNARPAHVRLRKTLAEMAAWNDEAGPNEQIAGSSALGIITSGVSFQHVREVAPEASVLKLGMTYPLPLERMRAFAAGVKRWERAPPASRSKASRRCTASAN